MDGDTVELADGRRVRVLGIDSCEADTAAGSDATADAQRLAEGRSVVLRAEPGVGTDRYGRLLRYVTLPDGTDFALAMIRFSHTGIYSAGGDADPGYVASLRAADDGPWVCEGEATPAPEPGPAPAAEPEPRPEPAVSNCHSSYQPCLPDGPDLDCGKIRHSVSVVGPDEYRLDGDDDGTGCDSYAEPTGRLGRRTRRTGQTVDSRYESVSVTAAPAAAFCTDSHPFLAAAFVS